MKEFTYTFRDIERCNMCHSPSGAFKVLGKRLNQSQGFRPSRKIGITTTIVQCTNCRLIFSDPMPVPASVQDHYGVPPEEYWNDDYFKVDENYFVGEINWLKRLKKIEPGMKSLDVGAGLGKQMIALKKQGFDAYGFEASHPFYSRAIEKMGIDESRLQMATIEEAEYETEMFDFISFGAVLEHFYDPSAALVKAVRWLKQDGLIHIEVPNAAWLTNKIINTIYRIMGTDYVGNISPMHVPYHLYEFSLDSFRRNARINNYNVRDHGYYVCDTFMPKVLDPLLKPYMHKTDTGMQLCVWLEK